MHAEVKVIQEQYKIIGRAKELNQALAAAHAKRHILFEGTVGVGKTVVAMALAKHLNRRFYRVDGDERYTEQRLTGWFDPPLVMAKGYSWETFIPGPLTEAMMEGAFLFINELNRMPEGTQNVLLSAMDERQIILPKIGAIKAKPGFLIIATQNPEEFVGTSRLSEALKDRFVWILLNYQSEDEERKIVGKETGCNDDERIAIAVKIARRTREDPEIRRGASVRGATDIVDLTRQFSGLSFDISVWTKASVAALATKIELQDQTTQNIESVIKKIVTCVLNEYPKCGKKKEPLMQLSEKSESPATANQSQDLRIFKEMLRNRDVQGMVYLIRGRPKSIYEIFSEKGLFEKMLRVAECAEAKWSAVQLLFSLQSSLDPARRRVARRILTRTILRLAAQIAGKGIGPTEYTSVSLKPGLEEFDIDQTLENTLGKNSLDYNDIVSIEKRRRKSSTSLMLDASNSMQREKIAIAALGVGILAYKLRDDHYSVITFKDDAQVLKAINEKPNMEKLIDNMLDLQAGGLTNVGEALERGLEELNKLHVHERAGILVTDGWVTKGPDPIEIAKRFPRLHVVQVPLGIGGGDSETCAKLAKAGKGKYYYINNFHQLPRTIIHVLK